MPTHCCVPLCTRKGYCEEETREKVSYFKFPTQEKTRKQWIHAIWRDEGKDFQISSTTKVCLRHFKPDDLKKSLDGVISLRQGAVPSVFTWKRSSPRKRPPPTSRISSTATSVSRKISKTIAEVVEASCSREIVEESSNLHVHTTSTESHLAPEMEEFPSAVNDLQSEENQEITRLEKLLAETIEIKEKLELEVSSLKQKLG